MTFSSESEDEETLYARRRNLEQNYTRAELEEMLREYTANMSRLNETMENVLREITSDENRIKSILEDMDWLYKMI